MPAQRTVLRKLNRRKRRRRSKARCWRWPCTFVLPGSGTNGDCCHVGIRAARMFRSYVDFGLESGPLLHRTPPSVPIEGPLGALDVGLKVDLWFSHVVLDSLMGEDMRGRPSNHGLRSSVLSGCCRQPRLLAWRTLDGSSRSGGHDPRVDQMLKSSDSCGAVTRKLWCSTYMR